MADESSDYTQGELAWSPFWDWQALQSFATGETVLCSTARLQPIADSFAANIGRVQSLFKLPDEAFFQGRRFEHYDALAHFQEFGSPYPKLSREDESLKKSAVAMIQAHRWFAKEDPHPPDGRCGWMLAPGKFIGAMPERFSEGVRTLKLSAVIATWSALEVLAGDLWEEAINSHPGGLADLRGKPNRIELLSRGKIERYETAKAASEAKSDDSESDLTVRLSDIREITRGCYDLSERMGTLLRKRREVDKLAGVRESYSRAFWTRSETIDRVLADPAWDALKLVRDKTVHKAARADKEYEKKCTAFPNVPRISDGHPIDARGDELCSLVNPAVQFGCSLIEAVDHWLKTAQNY